MYSENLSIKKENNCVGQGGLYPLAFMAQIVFLYGNICLIILISFGVILIFKVVFIFRLSSFWSLSPFFRLSLFFYIVMYGHIVRSLIWSYF